MSPGEADPQVLLMVCYLGLGANIGRPVYQLAAAISARATNPHVSVQRISAVYSTKPVGAVEQPDFFNMVVAISTELSPMQLLEMTGGIEDELGRVREVKDGPRTIDIDILLCGGMTWDDAELTVPHPRMEQRQFVLAPLSEMAPELILPNGRPVLELLEEDCGDVEMLGRLGVLVRGGEGVVRTEEIVSRP